MEPQDVDIREALSCTGMCNLSQGALGAATLVENGPSGVVSMERCFKCFIHDRGNYKVQHSFI